MHLKSFIAKTVLIIFGILARGWESLTHKTCASHTPASTNLSWNAMAYRTIRYICTPKWRQTRKT